MMDCATDCIQQGGATPHGIVPIGQRFDVLNIYPVMYDLTHIVEKYGGDQSFAVFFFLLLNHGVETANGISFKSTHRSTAVKYKDDLCQVLPHDNSSHKKTVTVFSYSHSIGEILFCLVA